MVINIDELIKQALKSQNKTELRAYRNLKAEFLKAETAKNAKPMDYVRRIQVLQKYIKTLEKSISDFSEAYREDLVADYRDELEVLQKLLPEPINESQIYSFIENDEEYFEKFWVTKYYNDSDEGTYMEINIPKKEMGNAIKHLKSKFPQADGKMISDIVKEYLI